MMVDGHAKDIQIAEDGTLTDVGSADWSIFFSCAVARFTFSRFGFPEKRRKQFRELQRR